MTVKVSYSHAPDNLAALTASVERLATHLVQRQRRGSARRPRLAAVRGADQRADGRVAPGARLGPDDDLHVMIQGPQHPAQPVNRESVQPALPQVRQLRLRYSDDRGGRSLGEAALFHQLPDNAREINLGGQLISIREPKVREHVAAALGDLVPGSMRRPTGL